MSVDAPSGARSASLGFGLRSTVPLASSKPPFSSFLLACGLFTRSLVLLRIPVAIVRRHVHACDGWTRIGGASVRGCEHEHFVSSFSTRFHGKSIRVRTGRRSDRWSVSKGTKGHEGAPRAMAEDTRDSDGVDGRRWTAGTHRHGRRVAWKRTDACQRRRMSTPSSTDLRTCRPLPPRPRSVAWFFVRGSGSTNKWRISSCGCRSIVA